MLAGQHSRQDACPTNQTSLRAAAGFTPRTCGGSFSCCDFLVQPSCLHVQPMRYAEGMQRYHTWLVLGAVFGCLGVVLGSYGAHGLEGRLRAQHMPPGIGHDGMSHAAAYLQIEKKLRDWETGARYQMYHALALLAVGLMAARRCGAAIHVAGLALALGTLLFSGFLYAYVLGAPKWVVHVVPFGGLLLIVGWASLIVAALRHREPAAARQPLQCIE